jgi:Cu/Zn superoxide dismutase
MAAMQGLCSNGGVIADGISWAGTLHVAAGGHFDTGTFRTHEDGWTGQIHVGCLSPS